eukprot:scaffold8071_cov116-Isochrysis_galbana.AAC.5
MCGACATRHVPGARGAKLAVEPGCGVGLTARRPSRTASMRAARAPSPKNGGGVGLLSRDRSSPSRVILSVAAAATAIARPGATHVTPRLAAWPSSPRRSSAAPTAAMKSGSMVFRSILATTTAPGAGQGGHTISRSKLVFFSTALPRMPVCPRTSPRRR